MGTVGGINQEKVKDKFNSDVTQFNDIVKAQLDALQSRGETSNDIMVNLFKGYKAITDSQFKK